MLKLKKLLVYNKNKVCNVSELNNTSFVTTHHNELSIADNINAVIEGFNNGSTITVFKGNRTILLSSRVHNEATLMKYINCATTVRICG